jgi:hypothetical protein
MTLCDINFILKFLIYINPILKWLLYNQLVDLHAGASAGKLNLWENKQIFVNCVGWKRILEIPFHFITFFFSLPNGWKIFYFSPACEKNIHGSDKFALNLCVDQQKAFKIFYELYQITAVPNRFSHRFFCDDDKVNGSLIFIIKKISGKNILNFFRSLMFF